jgi:hypothetical protein
VAWWKILDASVLLLCASMYLGTGWSLVLFSFPGRDKLTIDNYYDQFVPPVERATRFFTWWTVLMMAAAVVLIIATGTAGTSWRRRYSSPECSPRPG